VRGELLAVADDPLADRLDVGTVVADEHHEEAIGAANGSERVALAVGAREVEVDGLAAEITHLGLRRHGRISGRKAQRS
jgi:hypothetical protein